MRHLGALGHHRLEAAQRMGDHLLVVIEPRDLEVLLRVRAAGEHEAAFLLLVRQRKVGIGLHLHAARIEAALAGAAIARPAAMRIGHAQFQRRFQQRLVLVHLDRLAPLGNLHDMGHGMRALYSRDLMMPSHIALASPNSIIVFSLKKSGLSTPA